MLRDHDLVFLKHFSQVIAVLVGITGALILLGIYINGLKEPEPNPVAIAATEARIRPAGAVYAGETGAAAQAAVAAAAAAAAKAQVAFDGTLDGAVIYGQVCASCHGTGVLGAPKLEKAAWASRMGVGAAGLAKHAIDGYDGPGEGVMPARGNNPSLTDEQVTATVDWMLGQIK